MSLDVSYLRNLAHRCARLAHNCPDQKTSHELDAICAELMARAAESATEIVDSPAAPVTTTIFTISPDPLRILLRRYEAELTTFDNAIATDQPEPDWSRIAEETWCRTQDEIIEQEPAATTAACALLALDHVLQTDDLFEGRTEIARLQVLWLLVKAARDYVATMTARDN
jgi:hypothetical protein